MPALPVVLWELRGRSGKPLTCGLLRDSDGLFRLTVRMGEQEVLSERFSSQVDATAHSTFVREDFARQGWTETYRREE